MGFSKKAGSFLIPPPLISAFFYKSPSRILQRRPIGYWRWFLLAALLLLPATQSAWGSFL